VDNGVYMQARAEGIVAVTDRHLGKDLPGEEARRAYSSVADVFEHDFARLVKALTLVAGERDRAADAVQEAFARLVNRWDKVGSYEDPAGWVRRVALNLIRDQQRAALKQTRLVLKLEQQRPPVAGLPQPDQELWEQVRRLPLRQRTALALYYVCDLPTRDTATAMRVSEGTVERHLDRARKTLKAALKEAYDE
jgi:RNA polymerase sigma-70 factor (ECF subfamily)